MVGCYITSYSLLLTLYNHLFLLLKLKVYLSTPATVLYFCVVSQCQCKVFFFSFLFVCFYPCKISSFLLRSCTVAQYPVTLSKAITGGNAAIDFLSS